MSIKKMIKNIKNKNLKQKGQTLLFVVVAVTIALAVGVAVSTRTISSLRRVTRTDTSTRAIAAAEGGIENLLGRTYSDLDKLLETPSEEVCSSVEASFDDQEGKCYYVISDTSDQISSRTYVTVEKFRTNEEDGGYSFSLDPGSVNEVSVPTSDYVPSDEAYDSDVIEICWKDGNSAIYYYSYNSDGDTLKGGIYPSGTTGQTIDPNYLSRRFESSDSQGNKDGFGDAFCKVVSLVKDHYGLRVKVLYSPTRVAVFPASNSGSDPTLPYQGYKITSTGDVGTDAGSEEKATVIVHKSYPFASDIFDYGIYTPSVLD